jgi:rhodanese-related sulfurtransferase
LIDVREPDEVAQGVIPTAFSIPLSGFVASIRMEPGEFYVKHGFKKPSPDEEIVFYCRSGKRSATACDSAMKNGYNK